MASTITYRPIRSNRHFFAHRCAQLAHGNIGIHSSQKPTLQSAQWVQQLPTRRSEYEDFLETVMEAAVGRLVYGHGVAAEELELSLDYSRFGGALPGTWVRVHAQTVHVAGKTWIQSSVLSQSSGKHPEVYAYGRWLLVKSQKQYLHQ